MEILGLETESKGRWEEASEAYNQASMTARAMGQLQKAVSLGTKAVELARSTTDPRLQIEVIRQLAFAFRDLGLFENEREWLEKGIATSKQIPEERREMPLARLHGELGANYLSRGEGEKAIDHISDSVLALESLGVVI